MIPAIGSAAAGALGFSFMSKQVTSGASLPAGGKERKQQVRIMSLAEDQDSSIKNLLIAGSIGAGAMIAIGGIRLISNNEMAERKREEMMRHKEVKEKLRILNKNSKARFNNLDVGIRSEQRAGFRILSNQIQSLSEVAIQTLSEVAKSEATKHETPGKEGEPNEEVTRKTEALLNFARKAQEDSDRLTKEETYESAVTFYRTQLRATVGGTPCLKSPTPSSTQLDNGCTDMDNLEKMNEVRKIRKRRNFYKKIAMGLFGIGIAAFGVSIVSSDTPTKR